MFADHKERRKHHRLDFRIPMRYKKIETNVREFKGSLMRNISAGGTAITISEFLALNSRLTLEIPLILGKRPMQGVGRVAWVKKVAFGEQYDVGVEFVNLDQGDDTQIADFIFTKITDGHRWESQMIADE